MRPQTRIAVRIVLLDDESRVLLFEGRDLSDASDSVRFWFTAGGGVDGGEDLEVAARRELREETGLSAEALVGPFHRREFDFLDHGRPQHQVEHFFAIRTDRTDLVADGWTDLERRAMTTWRWWSAADLETSDATYFPGDLPDLVRRASDLV